jgi:elongation factor G
VIEVEPGKRGSGIEVEDRIRGGSIPREFIPSVVAGVREALNTGPLSGFPIIDMKVMLVDGSFHEVDSSQVSFKIAGSMAAKEAVRRAHPVVLEPIMRLEVVSPGEFLGDVLGDLGRHRANIRNIEGQGDTQVVQAAPPTLFARSRRAARAIPWNSKATSRRPSLLYRSEPNLFISQLKVYDDDQQPEDQDYIEGV